jgi:hypothetical protein
MKKQLKNCLVKHDWYFEYSDNRCVYERGYSEYQNIIKLMVQLECPFSFLELQSWRFGYVIGPEMDQLIYLRTTEEAKKHGLNFPVDEPGYYKRTIQNWAQVPVNERLFISSEKYNGIEQWFEK